MGSVKSNFQQLEITKMHILKLRVVSRYPAFSRKGKTNFLTYTLSKSYNKTGITCTSFVSFKNLCSGLVFFFSMQFVNNFLHVFSEILLYTI